MCETLSRALGVPFDRGGDVLAQSRYVNEEIEAILQRLVDGRTARRRGAERHVFIDEIDKLKGPRSCGVSGESVQHALPKIMEGCMVKPQRAVHRHHQHPFHLRWRVRRPEKITSATHTYGYISTSADYNLRS
jgi:ATP-dependent protease Clp ATPase subunit